MKCKLVLLSAMLLLSFDVPHAADSVAVWLYDKTGGTIMDPATDTVFTTDSIGNSLSYEFRIGLESGVALGGMSLGFRIWSDDGVEWQYDAQPGGWGEGGQDMGFAAVTVAPGSRLDPPGDAFDMTQLMITEKNIDGVGSDSLVLGGASMLDSLTAGPMEHMLSVHFTPALYGVQVGEVKTLCVDSAFVPPAAEWVFVDVHGMAFRPVIGPAICLPVVAKCPHPDAPLPVSPMDGARGLTQPVLLDWDDVDGADKYRVQVDDHYDFSSPEIDIESVPSYYDASGLADGTWHWWRVRAHNSCGWGRWNDITWSFMTEHAGGQLADSVAVWIYDKAGGTILDPATDTVFTEDSLGNPLSYEIRIALESDVALCGMSLGFRIWSDSGVEWQYDAQPGGWGEGGQDLGFAAVTVASGSRLDPPGDAFDVTELMVTEQNIDGMLDDTLVFGGASLLDSLVAGPMEHMLSVHFTPALVGFAPAEGKTFCIDSALGPPPVGWVYNDARGTIFPPAIGPAICFPVATNCPLPEAPLPVSPADGAAGLAQPVHLDWDDVSGADKYRIQLDNDWDFGSPEIDSEIVTSYYDASGLADGTWYEWRVSAHNDCGWGDWNDDTRDFMTKHVVPFADSVAVWIYDKTNDRILIDPATDTIYTTDYDGYALTYEIRIALENDVALGGMSLGFRIWSDDGVEWQYDAQPGGWGQGGQDMGFAAVTVASGSRFDPPDDAFDLTKLLITEENIDGMQADTLIFGGVSLDDSLARGPMEHMLSIHFTPSPVWWGVVKTLCIDSAFVPPAGAWIYTDCRGMTFPPAIGPSLCFPVTTLLQHDADDGNSAVPFTFTLGQNYPNPFNPITTIEYDLPRAEQTTLEVYNILGQRIRILVKGIQRAGHHAVKWDGQDNSGTQVATGIYFYRLKSGNHETTRKMVLGK